METLFDFDATKKLLHDSGFYYMICADLNGNYSYINNRYAKAFSYINENFIGQPYHITMHPDDTEICKEVGALCFANPGKLFPATIRKHDGKGGYIVTQWEYTLMVEHGEITGIFCVGFDITEFVWVKNKVQLINKDLENKNEILEAIAFEQAHLVRAPLANIIGLVSLLKNCELQPDALSIVNLMKESCTRLDDVIKSIVIKI